MHHHFTYIIQLICPPAVLPDLSIVPRQRRDVAHLDHARHKVREEGALAADVGLYLWVGGAAIEELLVRMQEPFFADKVLVVVVLEGGRGLEIKRR